MITEAKGRLSPREVAVRVLMDVFFRGAYANLALDRALRTSGLSAADRSLTTELVNGTIRMKKHLEWVLDFFLVKSRARLQNRVYAVLMEGAYQLLFLERVPAYAVINEAVNLARPCGSGAAGMVNAVLRNLERNRDSLEYPNREQHPVQYLSVIYSHPEWLVERWLLRYGEERTTSALAFDNQVPPLTVRVNLLRSTREEALRAVSGEGLQAAPCRVVPEGLTVTGLSSPIYELESYRRGLYYVQAEAPMLMARALCPLPGDFVYDICCGVGGKSTHLAEIMDNQGRVTGMDIYPHKLELLDANCRRLGINIVDAAAGDILQEKPGGPADAVILDAPCSGLGVLAARADLRWRRGPEDIKGLARIQERMLEAVAGLVRPGGKLAYCTCTVEPEENEMLVENFLCSHSGFEMLDLTPGLGFYPFSRPARVEAENGRLGTVPGDMGLEGIFIALMRRH